MSEARDALLNALETQQAIDAHEQWVAEGLVEKVGSELLIKELYDRGVSVKDIFGRYYEFDEINSAQTLDVEDARLAGHGGEPEPKAF